ncbi:MAG: autotransporter-associated beta strand repeat-containing protein, partial [Verrucomicrobiota bacterium]
RYQNKNLTISAGSANVVFSGDNDYSKLATLTVGAGTLTFNTDNAISDQVIWGDISGAGALAKAGEGVLVLGGSNTFAGGITLSKGALVLDRTSTLSDSGQVLGSPVGLGTLYVTPSSDGGATLAFTENVLLKNKVVLSGAGITLEVDSNAVELAGNVAFDSNPVSLYGPSFSALTLSGTGNTAANLVVYGMSLRAGSGALVDGSTITLNGGATLSSARQFTLSAGSLASDDLALNVSLVVVDEGKLNAGGGTLTMNGVVSGDGKLVIGNDSSFGAVRLTNTNTFTGGITVQDGATLKFTTDGNLGDAAGSVTLETGVLSYLGGAPLVINSARSLVVSQSGLLDAGAGALTWAGEITGTGDLTIGNEDTTGSVILSSGSSAGFAGRVIVSGGSLVIGHASALASAAVDLRNTSRLSDSGGYVTGGTLAFTGITSGTFGSLAGDRALALPSNFGLTLGGDQTSSVYSGSLSGSGASLTKVGSGAFTLSGENSYSGVTEVQGGALLVANKRALAQSTLNLISTGGKVVFSTSEVILGGLSGSGSLTITDGRRFTVGGNNLSTTYSGVIAGTTGIFEKAGTGNLTLAGTSTFRGEVSLSGGSLTLGKYSLQNSTLKVGSLVSQVNFTTNEAILGGLSGTGALNLASGAKLTLGGNNVSTLYSGVLGSGSVSLTKAGTGNFQLDGASGGPTAPLTLNIQAGGMLLSPTVSLTGGSVSLSGLSTLGIASNGGTLDYSATSFTLSGGTTAANLVFNGVGASSKLILPGSFDTTKIRVLNLGDGTILLGGSAVSSGSSKSSVSAGEVIPTSRPDKLDLGAGAKAVLPATSSGTLDLSQASSATGGAYQIPSDGVYTMSVAPSTNAKGSIEVPGQLNLSFGAVSGVVS